MGSAQPIARLYATAVGALLTIAGLGGFLVSPEPGPGAAGDAGELFGVLAVNDLASSLHLALGLTGLAAAGARSAAYCAVAGVVLVVWALAGLIAAQGLGPAEIGGAVPVDSAGSLLRLALGIGGLAAAISSRPVSRRGGSRPR